MPNELQTFEKYFRRTCKQAGDNFDKYINILSRHKFNVAHILWRRKANKAKHKRVTMKNPRIPKKKEDLDATLVSWTINVNSTIVIGGILVSLFSWSIWPAIIGLAIAVIFTGFMSKFAAK